MSASLNTQGSFIGNWNTNTPNFSAAPGIWSLPEAQNFIAQRNWPGVGLRNNTCGYRAGGYYNQSNSAKFIFSTETNVSNSALIYSFYAGAGSCCSLTAGYNLGGYNTTDYRLVQKVRYSNDQWAAVSSANLLQYVWYANSNCINGNLRKGYACAGFDGATYYQDIQMCNMTNETSIKTGSNLTRQYLYISNVSCTNKVYVCGGTNSNGTVYYNYIDMINTATDIFSTGPGSLGYNTGVASTFSTGIRGYVLGGYDIGSSPRCRDNFVAVNFSTDLTTTLPNQSSVYPSGVAGAATIYNTKDGYVFGGFSGNGSGTFPNIAVKLAFSNEQMSSIGADYYSNDQYFNGYC